MRFRDYIDVDNVCRASHNLKTLEEEQDGVGGGGGRGGRGVEGEEDKKEEDQ